MSVHKSIHTPKGWDPQLWNRLFRIATRISRQELISLWLASIAGTVSEADFNRTLRDMQGFSKEELLGILDEIDERAAMEFISHVERTRGTRREK